MLLPPRLLPLCLPPFSALFSLTETAHSLNAQACSPAHADLSPPELRCFLRLNFRLAHYSFRRDRRKIEFLRLDPNCKMDLRSLYRLTLYVLTLVCNEAQLLACCEPPSPSLSGVCWHPFRPRGGLQCPLNPKYALILPLGPEACWSRKLLGRKL